MEVLFASSGIEVTARLADPPPPRFSLVGNRGHVKASGPLPL